MTIYPLTRKTFTAADYATLAAGDVVRHGATDEATTWNLLRSIFSEIELVPIAPGTDLYAEVGAGCSYVKTL